MVVVGGIKMVPNTTNSFSILITVIASFLLYLNYIHILASILHFDDWTGVISFLKII